MCIYDSFMSFHGLIAHFFLAHSFVLKYHSLSILLLKDILIGYFQELVIMNKAAINIHVQFFVWI